MIITKYGELSMSGNVERPAWTSESGTDMLSSYNHRHRRYLEKNFYIASHGYYRKPPTSTNILNFIDTVVSVKSNNKK